MAYAAKDGKDTVLFVDKEYVEAQKEEDVQTKEEEKESMDQSAAYDPETGEINWDRPCKSVDFLLNLMVDKVLVAWRLDRVAKNLRLPLAVLFTLRQSPRV